jgi:hypothetical protein
MCLPFSDASLPIRPSNLRQPNFLHFVDYDKRLMIRQVVVKSMYCVYTGSI